MRDIGSWKITITVTRKITGLEDKIYAKIIDLEMIFLKPIEIGTQ